jgi:hypothetical protein
MGTLSEPERKILAAIKMEVRDYIPYLSSTIRGEKAG